MKRKSELFYYMKNIKKHVKTLVYNLLNYNIFEIKINPSHEIFC